MSGYYKVELGALAHLTRQLSECAGDMRSAMRLLNEIGPKGSGYADLEKACDDFQASWGYGIKLIADATGGITEGLNATGKVYNGAEQALAESFKASGKADSK
jgi:hypothetical protein